MLRFGIISEVDPEKGKARVKFLEDDLVSAWLPVTQPKTQDDKYFYSPSINEQVWCLMDERLENGVIGGAIYSREDTPPDEAGRKKAGVKFSDGTLIEYDKDARRVKVKIDATEFTITPDGYTVSRNDETLKKILEDLLTQIINETHPTPAGPSGPPNNVTAYQAIKERLPNLFEG